MITEPRQSHSGLARAIARLALERDPQAWRLVVERAGADMHRVAWRVSNDASIVEDALQEAFMQVRDSASQFHPRGVDGDKDAMRWILSVTRNTTLDLLRRRRVRARASVTSDVIAADPPPGTRLEQAERDAIVRREVAGLPDTYRSTIVMHYFLGQPLAAVASERGLPLGTVKTHLHRGLDALRSKLSRIGIVLTITSLTALLDASSTMAMPAFTPASYHPLLTAASKATVGVSTGGLSMATKITLACAASLILSTAPFLLSQERRSAEADAVSMARSTPLARAQGLQKAGRFQEAAEAYLAIVQRDRADLLYSAPALVGWVECCQRGKDDDRSAKEYRMRAGRYLSSPPPLDGTSTVTLVRAREDLLWKPWSDAAAFTASVRSTQRFDPPVTTSGGTVQPGDHIAKSPWYVGLDVMPEKSLAIQRGSVIRTDMSAEAPGGAVYPGRNKGMDDPALHDSYLPDRPVMLSFEFPDAPVDLKMFTRITGTMHVTQAAAWAVTPIRLLKGASWTRPEGTWTIESIRLDHAAIDIIFSLIVDPRSDEPSVATDRQVNDFHGCYWLQGQDGKKTFPTRCQYLNAGTLIPGPNGSHGVDVGNPATDKPLTIFTFANPGDEVHLMSLVVTEVSVRDFPFACDNVELRTPNGAKPGQVFSFPQP